MFFDIDDMGFRGHDSKLFKRRFRLEPIFNNDFTANLPSYLPVERWKSVQIRQNDGHEFVASLFGPPFAVRGPNCVDRPKLVNKHLQ